LLAAVLSIAVGPGNDVGAAQMRQTRTVGQVPIPSSSLIVGRARCHGRVWLLTSDGQLVAIAPATRSAETSTIRDLGSDAKPWGLACLHDGSLWTIGRPYQIVRLTRDGGVGERVNLRSAWINLYGLEDRLLFQSASLKPGGPVLAITRPGEEHDSRPWSTTRARSAPKGVNPLMHNLVRCGLGPGRMVPCWFGTDTEVSYTESGHTERERYEWIRNADVDPAIPIRDVAATEHERVWILATSRRLVEGRSVGHRLFLVSRRGGELARVELTAPARLIVDATGDTCLLLTTEGQLVEIAPK
jgi:hypothetical protein